MATNYGITDQGFTRKRLLDIINDQNALAVQLFQDLTAAGEIVDTSISTALGRLIALAAPGDADLWEVAQQSWSALDPNSATGVSLDNIAQYGGIARFSASASTATALFAGDNGTLIAGGSVVRSLDNSEFSVSGSVALSPSKSAGITLTASVVANTTLYTLTYTAGITGSNTISYTSSGAATATEIVTGFKALIDSSHPLLSASLVGDTLVVDMADVFQVSTFSTSSNLAITKVKKIGQLVAVEVGVINQDANTITEIVTPVLGWDSVTNPLDASPGRLVETDEELRLRFRNTKLERSSNILDSLYSALFNVDGVQELAIYENDTDTTDSNGVLPHSFLPVVLGGSSQIIAETIWQNKPMGIASQGNTEVPITDSQGFLHNIGFERPTPVTIYIDMVLSLNPEAPVQFPSDGADQIRAAIQTYASENFGVGKDVIYSRMFTPINTIPGHQIDSLSIGTTPSPVGTSNLVITFADISSFESVNINITVS
jgi:uncharacterized phage protein gp47/JayE